MEILCDNCDARLSVPDEQIRNGRSYKVTCPRCDGEVRLDIDSGGENEEISSPKKPSGRKAGGPGASPGFTSLLNPAGGKTALLLDADPEETMHMKETIEKMGYGSVHAENTRDAIGQLRFHHFDLIIMTDRFDDVPWSESPVLNYINTLNMSARRRMFVALLGEGLKTRDPMKAFSLSVNLVVDREDKASFQDIFEQAIAENENFYRVFMEISTETGKA